MPTIRLSKEYQQNWYSFNKHLATIVPSTFRKVTGFEYQREQMLLSDGDFLDLDWVKNNAKRLIVITHGLEGSSDKQYVKGLAVHFANNGWDVLAWNCRSCSGEMNIAPKLYHHGDIDDISEVLKHISVQNNYKEIGLAGYSMGGVINTKFIALGSRALVENINFNIAISTPCDLQACAKTLDKKSNFIYKKKFMKNLMAKLIAKEQQFPGIIKTKLFDSIHTWEEFDELISAPFNGYKNATELYKKATINQFLDQIHTSTLILNSVDDPMIPLESNPIEYCKDNAYIKLVLTDKGGHCGFMQNGNKLTFAEEYALEFANAYVK